MDNRFHKFWSDDSVNDNSNTSNEIGNNDAMLPSFNFEGTNELFSFAIANSGLSASWNQQQTIYSTNTQELNYINHNSDFSCQVANEEYSNSSYELYDDNVTNNAVNADFVDENKCAQYHQYYDYDGDPSTCISGSINDVQNSTGSYFNDNRYHDGTVSGSDCNGVKTESARVAFDLALPPLPPGAEEFVQNVTNSSPMAASARMSMNIDALSEKAFSSRNATAMQEHYGIVSQNMNTSDWDDEDEDEQPQSETYSQYIPSKLKLGVVHPDPVVETSSLSSVTSPDIWYNLQLPKDVITRGLLSSLQLEAVVYGCQQHNTWLPDKRRAGFLIGDGAGVGKGRILAAIIYENYVIGRKRAVWFSVSNDLKYDAVRDLRDIGAERIPVYSLNKFKYGKISAKVNGSVRKGVIFATYSSLIGESQGNIKYRTRLSQLIRWLGEDFDGVIIFDECHKAKNLCPTGTSKSTKTGRSVLALQNKLPKARIVYASATGASEPRNMAYMNRLGIWGTGTPFREFGDFIRAIDKGGVSAMELVAMDMKLSGMYIARQLSFAGVNFEIQEVSLASAFKEMYNKSVRLWVDALAKFQKGAELLSADNRLYKTMWGQFWSAHQRFFKYLCIAAKVKTAVAIAKRAIADGKCVVIGLQSTGEAQTLGQLEETGGELSDFVSTAKGVFSTLVDKHFPAPNRQRLASVIGFDYMMRENEPANDRKRKYDEVQDKIADHDLENDNDDNVESDVDSESEEDVHKLFEFLGSESDGAMSADDEPVPKRKARVSKTIHREASFTLNEILAASGIGPSFQKPSKKYDSPKLPNQQSVCYSNVQNCSDPSSPVERAIRLKEELLQHFQSISSELPPNTLDELIDELGGPNKVAEMTGRKGRVVCNTDGSVSYESRCKSDVPLEVLNLKEKERFMEGQKLIAIISEAASSGISLQADKRVKNQCRRVHITLELPWSADRAVQQFGRTHRSNQVSAPEYLFLISELAGEQRFASIIARRLESLGALTHGDRRATETRDFSRYNFDNKHGRAALETVFGSIVGNVYPVIPPPADYSGGRFFDDIAEAMVGVGLVTRQSDLPTYALEKDHNSIPKFLNRILGIQVELQNRLFAYFNDVLSKVIYNSKKAGKWENGILDFGGTDETVQKIRTVEFGISTQNIGTAVRLHVLQAIRGISWEQVLCIANDAHGNKDGFYLSIQSWNYKKVAVFIRQIVTVSGEQGNFQIFRPNTGLQRKQENYATILKKYYKSSRDAAKCLWINQYESAMSSCSHAFWRGRCKRVAVGLPCEVGMRIRTYHVLSGSVLSVWNCIETILLGQSQHNSKVQIVRLNTKDNEKIVGIIIPNQCVTALKEMLYHRKAETQVQNDI